MSTKRVSRHTSYVSPKWRRLAVTFLALAGLVATVTSPVGAHSIPDEGVADDGSNDGEAVIGAVDPTVTLEELDARDDDNTHRGGNRDPIIRDLELIGRGERNVADATTDVWVHKNYAYTGTFSSPCGGEPDAGIWVWNVRDKENPELETVILSPTGSRTNDVRVERLNSGDVLVHSNEPCNGGPGGFEIYNVRNPGQPELLASVRIDEINQLAGDLFGGVTDVGVHNLWLFKQGTKDYVAVTAEGVFDNFRIYEITDPTNPTLVSAWGAEELFDPGVGDETVDPDRVLNAVLDLLFGGYGASTNKFLHDVTIDDRGTMAYLSNWDAGLVLLDISDPADPQLVSVAIDPVNGSLDGEVNSHSAWPSENGRIVVEGEEDFSAWEQTVPPSNLTLDGTATPGDPTIPATAISTDDGDVFEASQTGMTGSTDGTTVDIDGGDSFSAAEMATAAGSPTFADTGTVSGQFVWIGRACTLTGGDELLNTEAFNAGDIAVVRRGTCEFQEKADAAAALGASAMVLANNQSSTPWSGLRIWDYSDPANPVLASTFDTVCSASIGPSDECVANGTYSVHNVQVKRQGNKTLAYISWYWDGILVLDVTDPYNPIEIARYLDRSGPNDGLANDFWGIFVEEKSNPWVYAADRNGGLYILKLTGNAA